MNTKLIIFNTHFLLKFYYDVSTIKFYKLKTFISIYYPLNMGYLQFSHTTTYSYEDSK